MFDLQNLKKIKRSNIPDKRNFKLGLRADRNEKIENWPISIFKKIFSKIKPHEFTAYYNTNELEKLKKNISKYYSISASSFIINHGGDGVIKEFLLLNYKRNLKVLINSCNYGMYYVYFKALKIKFAEIPYKINLNTKNIFELDKNFTQKNIKNSDIVFITNPNQIANKDFTIKEMKNLCKKYPQKKFFIDESYAEFGHFSFVNLTKKIKNIFVMRSITKSFGLASARIGFLIAHKDTIKSFKALETPYPVSLFSGKCLNYFLLNKKLTLNYNKSVNIGRKFICKKLRSLKYKVHDSSGLSILIYFKSKKYLDNKYNFLMKKFIYTKKLTYGGYNFLRITCGPKNKMAKVLKYL